MDVGSNRLDVSASYDGGRAPLKWSDVIVMF